MIVLLLLLVGCKVGETDPRDDLENYRCSEDKLAYFKKELAVCLSTSYRSSYCYKVTKMSVCTYTYPPKRKKKR